MHILYKKEKKKSQYCTILKYCVSITITYIIEYYKRRRTFLMTIFQDNLGWLESWSEGFTAGCPS